MTALDPLAFVAAAYGVILGGLALYAASIIRRLRRLRAGLGDTSESAALPDDRSPHPPE